MTLERAARTSFLVLVACAFVAACGGDEPEDTVAATEKMPVPKSKAREKLPQPSVKEVLKARVDLPDYYPEDAPVYAGAKTSSVGWQSGRVNAVFTTPDDPSAVSAELQSTLSSDGWGEIVEAEMVNGVVVQADKGERGISALVTRMEEGTSDEVTMIIVAVDP